MIIEVIEGTLVRYKDIYGYRVWGKVSQHYISAMGYECVELTDGTRLKASEILKVKYP
mgnify:CR=1 FL=1|jgi:hypothetical protein|uniref:Uncharacterized protein n=1 Tax=Caudovirales sp. ctTqA28 TaxID=2826775 RepID=A0A8S5MDH2_9CAUD|nr:MAG TPA: hypothetical protein [Caudovirales sp. ctTqA28]